METPIPPPLPVSPRPSWQARHPGRLAVLLGAILAVLILAIVCGIFFLVQALLRSSEPYKKAIAAAALEPALQRSLGTPIKPGFFVTGSIHLSDDSGRATLHIPVTGPNGRATLEVRASKVQGVWSYSRMQAKVRGSGQWIPLQP